MDSGRELLRKAEKLKDRAETAIIMGEERERKKKKMGPWGSGGDRGHRKRERGGRGREERGKRGAGGIGYAIVGKLLTSAHLYRNRQYQ